MTMTSFEQAMRSTWIRPQKSLDDLSQERPLLVVFLRHFGCTFCRETLADLQKHRAEIEACGVSIVLVHMLSDLEAVKYLQPYGLDDVDRISDPTRSLYQAFGLKLGNVRQLLGPSVWLRGLRAAVFDRHGVGMLAGNGLQMPGVFLVHRGEVVAAYRHETAGDRPDYCALTHQGLAVAVSGTE